MQTFEEIVNMVKQNRAKKEINKLGQELNRDIVKELKSGEFSPEMRKELNKQRISALNLKLIQGGKA